MNVGFERERTARDRYISSLVSLPSAAAAATSTHTTTTTPKTTTMLNVERASSLEERRRERARRSPSPLLGEAPRPALLRSSSCVEAPPPALSLSQRDDAINVEFDQRLQLVRRRQQRMSRRQVSERLARADDRLVCSPFCRMLIIIAIVTNRRRTAPMRRRHQLPRHVGRRNRWRSAELACLSTRPSYFCRVLDLPPNTCFFISQKRVYNQLELVCCRLQAKCVYN